MARAILASHTAIANVMIIRDPIGIIELDAVTRILIIKKRITISNQSKRRKIWVLIFIILKIRVRNRASIIIRSFIVFRDEPISDLQNQRL